MIIIEDTSDEILIWQNALLKLEDEFNQYESSEEVYFNTKTLQFTDDFKYVYSFSIRRDSEDFSLSYEELIEQAFSILNKAIFLTEYRDIHKLFIDYKIPIQILFPIIDQQEKVRPWFRLSPYYNYFYLMEFDLDFAENKLMTLFKNDYDRLMIIYYLVESIIENIPEEVSINIKYRHNYTDELLMVGPDERYFLKLLLDKYGFTADSILRAIKDKERFGSGYLFRKLLDAVEPGFFKRKRNRIKYDRIISNKEYKSLMSIYN